MTLLEGHWHLEEEINQLSNGNNPGLTDAEKDRLINLSINDFINLFFYGKNPKNLIIDGFEENQRRLDMFENLIVGYPEESKLSTVKTLADNTYSFDLTKTKQTYREYITAKIETTNCGDFDVSISQHNDGSDTDFHRRSSKKFKRVNALLRNNHIYFKATDFTPKALKLTYLKKPNEVSLGTYPDLNLTNQANPPNKAKVEWDINPDYQYIIITIAAQNYMRIYEKQLGYTLNSNKIDQQ